MTVVLMIIKRDHILRLMAKLLLYYSDLFGCYLKHKKSRL